MATVFTATWDYKCRYSRNLHEAIGEGVREGRAWRVTFVPFSLDQLNTPDREPKVWERAEEERPGALLALQWAIVVRDRHPDRFLDFHMATFRARWDDERRVDDPEVMKEVARSAGVDPAPVHQEVESGEPLRALAREHLDAVERWGAFSVPTVIVGEDAAFVRLMERRRADDLERVLDLIGFTRLDEFKRPHRAG